MNTKELTVTIPYDVFNDVVIAFDLNNQDEMDACITSFIEEKLAIQMPIFLSGINQ